MYLVHLGFWGLLLSQLQKIGRGAEVKGHFSSSTSYILDYLVISQLPAFQEASFLQQKYLKEGLSAKEIALASGCSATTIKYYLRSHGISKADQGATVHRKNLSFGKKIVGHGVVAHKTEAQVIATIKKMYTQEGLYPTAIARILDGMRVPTKQQGKKWDHSVVIAILEREGVYEISRNSPRKGGQDGKNN